MDKQQHNAHIQRTCRAAQRRADHFEHRGVLADEDGNHKRGAELFKASARWESLADRCARG